MSSDANKISAKLPAGRYYIGDLSFIALDAGYDTADMMPLDDAGVPVNGLIKTPDGAHCFIGSTAQGDGIYSLICEGCVVCELVVDTARIGILHIDQMDVSELSVGTAITFDSEFGVSLEDGYFDFGGFTCDTYGY